MADIEKTPVITFKTEDSGLLKGVTSVKELKLAIAQLKDEIVRMRQAGEDTTKQTTQLQAAQRELNTVMGLTKKGVDGVEGSYDSLVAKLREAKTEWRALPKFINGELNPAWEKARQQVEQYNTELKNYDASVGVYTRNVGNYKSALEGFSGTMGQAAQIGGDFRNGLAAMSGIMTIVGADTSDMNDAMKNLQITVGVLHGLKGFGGLLKQLGDYLKLSAKSVTATKADTVAKKANADATTAMAGAETAAAGATTLLGVALKALGIGLIISALSFIVAHLEDIVKWVTDLGVKLGIVKEKSEDEVSLTEKAKKNYEKEKEELDKQVRIMQAKGKSQKDILKFQIQQIEASIKTKEAELESAKATLERLKQHNWLQRVLKGEQKEYKQLNKYIEEATAQLEEQRKARENYKFDLELEGYREEAENRRKAQTDAERKAAADAAKLAKERAEAWKKGDETIKKGVDAATKSIQDQETAVQKLDREWKETEKIYEAATKETKKRIALYEAAVTINKSDAASTALLVQETKNLEKLEKGLIYEKEAYYGKRYEIESAEKEKQINDSLKERYGILDDVADAQERILGKTYTLYDTVTDISWKDRQRVNSLKAQVEAVKEYLSTVENINADIYNSKLTREDYEKEFGLSEPAITALLQYFSKSAELKEAQQDALANMLTGFESAFNDAISRGDFKQAYKLWGDAFYSTDEYGQKLIEDVGIKAGYAYIEGFQKQIKSALAEDENPLAAYLGGTNWEAVFKEQNQKWLDILNSGTATWQEEWNARAMILENFGKRYGKFLSSYGSATTNVLSNTGNLWNNVIEAKQRDIDKLKEQGKISEKEYNRKTQENKKSFDNLKNLQIGTAIINTAAAVVQALADTTVPSYYVKAANAIAAGIAGAAEVVKIKSTDYSGGGSYSASNSSAPTITQTPAMVNTYGINPADYAEAAAQNPVRVYVVESDITEAQNAAKVRVSESTF